VPHASHSAGNAFRSLVGALKHAAAGSSACGSSGGSSSGQASGGGKQWPGRTWVQLQHTFKERAGVGGAVSAGGSLTAQDASGGSRDSSLHGACHADYAGLSVDNSDLNSVSGDFDCAASELAVPAAAAKDA
jgi:hypothetical protein